LLGDTPATQVTLFDSTFKEIARGLQRLKARVPAGVYEARFELGNAVAHHPFKLARGEEKEVIGPRQLAASPAPLGLTRPRRSRGVRSAPRIDLARVSETSADLRPGPGEGALLVLLHGRHGRHPRIDVSVSDAPVRWEELPGLRLGSVVLREGHHPFALLHQGARVCRTVPIVAGGQTVLSMQLPSRGLQAQRMTAALIESSLLVSPRPVSARDDGLLLQEMAQQALHRGRPLMSAADYRRSFASLSPFAMLLGAHGLVEARRALMQHPLEPVTLRAVEVELVTAAYERLRETWLSGSADVAALGSLIGKRIPEVSLAPPPLLVSTWRILVSASLERLKSVSGGPEALRTAQGLVASPVWIVWADRGAGAPRDLTNAALDLLEPELRPAASKLPSWAGARKFGDLASASAPTLARALQVPVPLVLQLARNLDDELAARRREKAGARLRALKDLTRVCLVVLPEGVREDPARGQPIDFEMLFDGALGDALAGAQVIGVRAPPVGLLSREMQQAIEQADLMLADLTFGDPKVIAVAAAWLAGGRGRARRLVQIRAEDQPAAESFIGSPPIAYTTSFGTGPSFRDPLPIRKALREAAAACDRAAPADRRRSSWLRAQARAVRGGLAIRESAGHLPALRTRSLHRESTTVQLDALLLFRSLGDWKGMLRVERVLSPSLRLTPLVREQRALALKWSARPGALDEAAQLLEGVIDEIGPNGETCGLLASVHKERWRRTDDPYHLQEAIRWYRWGMQSSPLDPYPGVNVLTLLAVKGTANAMAEHAELLSHVESASMRRVLARPGFWDLVAMMFVSVHKRDQRAWDLYARLALAAPHGRWQRTSALKDLKLLQAAVSPGFRGMADKLDVLIRFFRRGA